MLSLFYVLLFIAAGSNASPCKPASSSPASSSSGVTPTGYPPGSQQLSVVQESGSNNAVANSAGTQFSTGPGPGAQLNFQQQGFGSPLAQSSLTPSAASPSGAPAPSGSCPTGFINTVFNTDATKNVGWPNTVWSSLTSHGISSWIGFSLGTLGTKFTYDVNGSPAPTTPALNNAQIHLCMDPTDVSAAVQMVQGPSPPQYLGLFNEPDLSYMNLTITTDPVPAAQSLATLFNISHPQTTYIAPGVAFPNSNWLPSFRDACNNCFDQIPIMSMHIYEPDPAAVMAGIQQFHATWSDKRIWITELSPARDDCNLTDNASGAGSIGEYIDTLIPQIVALGYVDKIFWNGGEWDSTAMNAAPQACNPSLTDANGNPTTVLQALGAVCGGSEDPPAVANTATS